jgi:hypothetical protein
MPTGADARSTDLFIVLAETFAIERSQLGAHSLGRDRRIDGRAYKRSGGG